MSLSSHVFSINEYRVLRADGADLEMKVGNGGRPILLKIGTQISYVELCNMPKFQLPRPFFSPVLDINPSGVHRG